MPKTSRAKFTCDSVTDYGNNELDVSLSPDYTASAEDNQFSRYTPSGQLKMRVSNPELSGFFVPGKSYYMDFTPVD